MVDDEIVASGLADRPQTGRRQAARCRARERLRVRSRKHGPDLRPHPARRPQGIRSRLPRFPLDVLQARGGEAVHEHTDALGKLFFAEYYRHRHGLETLSNDGAFRHYVTSGIFQGHDPCPWFSGEYFRAHHGELVEGCELPVIAYLRHRHRQDVRPSSLFDPTYYANTYPELAGRDLLEHYVGHGHAEGRHPVERRLPAPVLEELEEMIELEPSLARVRTDPRSIVRYGLPVAANYVPRLVRRRFGPDIEAIVCVPAIGDACPQALDVASAYQRAHGPDRVLLIATDSPAPDDLAGRLGGGTRTLHLEDECDFNRHDAKIDALHEIVGLLAPARVVNVDSPTTWHMYRKFGAQMATVTALTAYVSRFERPPGERLSGHTFDHLPDLIGLLGDVHCASDAIVERMQALYGFSSRDRAKLRVAYEPVSDDAVSFRPQGTAKHVATAGSSILWIGELSARERPDLLVDIAAAMPAQRFVVHGPAGDSPHSASIIDGTFPNIVYRGASTDVGDVDIAACGLFLNTSGEDGISRTAIRMLGAGLPTVTSAGDGITELVTEESGWVVGGGGTVLDYVAQISAALIQRERAASKARRGQALFVERHTRDAFYRRLVSLGSFADGRRDDAPEGTAPVRLEGVR